MQVIKEDKRRSIVRVATSHFKKYGFLKASMRDIAKEAGVGVGNMYNYFTSKDELFRVVVQPVIDVAYAKLEEYHGVYRDIKDSLEPGFIDYGSESMFQIIKKNRMLLEILFFKAQGSSLEHFDEVFTERSTECVLKWLDKNKDLHPEMNSNISRFSIHMQSVFMFTLIREMVMHRLPDDEMRKVLQEYYQLEIFGWRELTRM